MNQIDNIPLWQSRIQTHLEFLNLVAKNHPDFFDEEKLVEYVSLYKKMLPLVAKHGSQNIWLPLPVVWIFHVHVLHPLEYMRDCEKNFGHLVLFNPKAHLLDPKPTHDLFEKFYGVSWEKRNEAVSTFESSKDLIFCATNQKTFTNQVQIFTNIDVATCVKNYHRFILCVKKALESNSDVPYTFVPTLEIDLVWHTHMRYPYDYLTFVKQETGYLLNHEDDVADLEDEFVKTAQFWKDEYNEDYVMTKKAECCNAAQHAATCTIAPMTEKAECCNAAQENAKCAVLTPAMTQKAECCNAAQNNAKCAVLVPQTQKAECCNAAQNNAKCAVLAPAMNQKAECCNAAQNNAKCAVLLPMTQKAECCNAAQKNATCAVLAPAMTQKAECCNAAQNNAKCAVLLPMTQKAECCNAAQNNAKCAILLPASMTQKAECCNTAQNNAKCAILLPSMTQKAECCNAAQNNAKCAILLPSMTQKAECCNAAQNNTKCAILLPAMNQKADCCNVAQHSAACTILAVKEHIEIPRQLETIVYA